ncbi:MAG: efflux RND transporter periplasmic adaptor subunit [Paludibacteraceae bacterium]|nr:efflux RND transporter periplasmic adaptor subunit [Paludibacteraceae bacterium]
MRKSLRNILHITLLIFFLGCGSGSNEIISTYRVQKSDFVDAIFVDGYAEPVRSMTISCPQGIDGTVLWIIDDGSMVNAGDEICMLEDNNLTSEYEESLIALENAEANLNKVRANHQLQISVLEAQQLTNNAESMISALDSLQLKYSSDNQRKIKELELERSAIDKTRFEKKFRATLQIQQSEIRGLEIQLQRVRMRVESSRQRLEALSIKAPQAGMVVISRSPMSGRKIVPGDNIWEGRPVCTMPEITEMKVLIMASEGNYKRIQLGDTVEFSFDAIPGKPAFGKVVKKAPIGQAVSRGSKVKLFEIEASVDSVTQIPDPGFSAQCKIILKRVNDTLTVPQIAVFETDSTKVVYVKQKNGYEQREVKTGLSSTKETIIVRGLKSNEYIALTQPPKKQIKNKQSLNHTDSKSETDSIHQNTQ